MPCCCAVQAAQLPRGSLERLLKVTAFAVSIYSCVYRPFAPFRSPTGETFEIVAPDKGIRAIGEKVRRKVISSAVPQSQRFDRQGHIDDIQQLSDGYRSVESVLASMHFIVRGGAGFCPATR